VSSTTSTTNSTPVKNTNTNKKSSVDSIIRNCIKNISPEVQNLARKLLDNAVALCDYNTPGLD
jgi:hypothetical protein